MRDRLVWWDRAEWNCSKSSLPNCKTQSILYSLSCIAPTASQGEKRNRGLEHGLQSLCHSLECRMWTTTNVQPTKDAFLSSKCPYRIVTRPDLYGAKRDRDKKTTVFENQRGQYASGLAPTCIFVTKCSGSGGKNDIRWFHRTSGANERGTACLFFLFLAVKDQKPCRPGLIALPLGDSRPCC